MKLLGHRGFIQNNIIYIQNLKNSDLEKQNRLVVSRHGEWGNSELWVEGLRSSTV